MVGYIISFTEQLVFGEKVERVPVPDHGFAVEVARLVTPFTVLAGVGEDDRIRTWFVGMVAEDALLGPPAGVITEVAEVYVACIVVGDVFVIEGGGGERIAVDDRAVLIRGVSIRPISTIVVPGEFVGPNTEARCLTQRWRQTNGLWRCGGTAAGESQRK